MEKPEKIVFQTAKYDDLVQVVKLKMNPSRKIFKEWFQYDYSLSKSQIHFMKKLIKQNINFLSFCSEEDLKMYFIAILLGKVRFRFEDKRGFYDKPLKAIVNGVEFGGKTDFMFAMGVKEPRKPYFFIQEFKQTKHSVDVEDQLLAEMLAAIELNKVNLIRGAYIVGRHWNFVILEKIAENSFQYFVSDSCDSLTFNGLKQIFVCLQAVKLKYCE